jgi:hypothetical protein
MFYRRVFFKPTFFFEIYLWFVIKRSLVVKSRIFLSEKKIYSLKNLENFYFVFKDSDHFFIASFCSFERTISGLVSRAPPGGILSLSVTDKISSAFSFCLSIEYPVHLVKLSRDLGIIPPLSVWHGIHETETILLILSGSDGEAFPVSWPSKPGAKEHIIRAGIQKTSAEWEIAFFMISKI